MRKPARSEGEIRTYCVRASALFRHTARLLKLGFAQTGMLTLHQRNCRGGGGTCRESHGKDSEQHYHGKKSFLGHLLLQRINREWLSEWIGNRIRTSLVYSAGASLLDDCIC